MKKYINIALVYALAAMAGGVFYREFTKLNGFSGRTSLAFVHTHLLVLGTLVFLLLALFARSFPMEKDKRFKLFCGLYHGGLAVTAATFVWRGVTQVLATPLSPGASAAISGVAGLGHISLGVGLVLFLLILKKAVGTTRAKA